MENEIVCTIPSNFESLDDARSKIKNYLEPFQLDSKKVHHILSAVSEWLNNLIEHSKNLPTSIRICASQTEDEVIIDIQDDGDIFFDMQQYVSKYEEMNKKDHFDEGGYGLFIIKSLFPNYQYHPKSTRNRYNHLLLPINLPESGKEAKHNIAVIEDDKTSAQLLSLYLKADYNVFMFYTASDFFDSIGKNDYHMIISDINLPEISGFDLRVKLRENPKTAFLPFVFITASSDEAVEENAYELGVDDFLNKPIRKSQIIAVVRRVIKRCQQSAKYHQESNKLLTDRITHALKPSLPSKIYDTELSLFSQNMDPGGGDFVLSLECSNFTLLLFGDVMGHGVEAKFFTHAYIGYIQAILRGLNTEMDIGNLLRQFSNLVSQDKVLENAIVTILGLQIFPNNVVRLANAGHPFPYIINDSGVQCLDIKGPLPGLEIDSFYSECEISLNDSILFVTTDGLFELGETMDERKRSEQYFIDNLNFFQNENFDDAVKHYQACYDDYIKRTRVADDITYLFIKG